MRMTGSDRREASRRLLEAEQLRVQVPGPSRTWPDMTLEDAYAIAAIGIETKVSNGARFIGHKVGLTSKAMQRSSQIDEPDFGTLLDGMVFEDGAELAVADYCVPRVEIELAFVMKHRLSGPGLGIDEAIDATDHIVPAIELIDARAEDPRTIYDTVSDNGAAAGMILGGRRVAPRELDLRWVGGLLVSNGEVEETGLAAGVLGHPANALVWLAAKLSEFDQAVEPGEIVLTGSFARPVWAASGDLITADFGGLGSVSVTFR